MLQNEFTLSLCDDGKVHAFNVLDDGAPYRAPMCGKPVKWAGPGTEQDFMCDDCVVKAEEFMGLERGSIADDD